MCPYIRGKKEGEIISKKEKFKNAVKWFQKKSLRSNKACCFYACKSISNNYNYQDIKQKIYSEPFT
jgi:hypothetical protein